MSIRAIAKLGSFFSGRRRFRQSTTAFWVSLTLLCGIASAQAQIALTPTDPRIPIITYEQTTGNYWNKNEVPYIRLFADGKLLVSYGDYEQPNSQYEVILTKKQMDYLVNIMLLPMLDAPSDILQREIAAVRHYVRARGELVEGVGSRGMRIKLDTFVDRHGHTKNNYRSYFLWSGYHAKTSTLANVKSRVSQLWRFAILEDTLRAIAEGSPAKRLESATGDAIAKPKQLLPVASAGIAMH